MPSEAPSVSGGAGIARAWGLLDRDRRLAALAAGALLVTMLLPWYQQNAVVTAAKATPLVSRNLNAFQVFSFVEAAVLAVSAAVLFLLYARADGRQFQLPGGDGTAVLAGGLWSVLLLVLRLFDKPSVTQHGVAANVGVQWGIFFALAAAGLLAYEGSRMRAAQRPGPPLVRPGGRAPTTGRPAERSERPPERDERPPERQPLEQAEQRAERSHESDEQEQTVVVPRATPVPAKRRPRYPPAPPTAPRRPAAPVRAEQLSFEDTDQNA